MTQRYEIWVGRMVVGAAIRRDVREAIAAVEVLGGTIRSNESKRFLESVFSFHATGTLRQLTPLTNLSSIIKNFPKLKEE